VPVSAAIALDYIAAKAVTYAITATSSGTVGYHVEATLDAPQLVTTPSWFTVSSAAFTGTAGPFSVQSPIAGIRISASALSSTLLTMQTLQNAGG